MTLASELQGAVQALNNRDYIGAREMLLPLSQQFPDVADVWQLLGLAYKGTDELASAEAAFHRSIALDPGQPHVLANLGNLYRRLGRPDHALEQYDQALTLDSTTLATWVNRGAVLLDLERFEEAENSFASVLQHQPNHLNARVGYAQALQNQGRQHEAIQVFQEVLADDSDNASALNGLGISLKVLGYADDAVDTLIRAARAAPESSEVQSNLASALVQADREEEAIAAYQRAIALDENNPDLHHWYNGYLGVLDHPDYLDSYRTVLESSPDAAALATPLARKLLLNHRGEEAREQLQRCLAAGGDPATLYRELSHVEREQDRFDESLAAARKAGDLQPNDVRVQQELANAIMASAADYEEAYSILGELVQRFPEDQSLWALYATSLRYTGREAEYRSLVDYDQLVNFRAVEPPTGFSSRAEFVGYLREALLMLHTTRRHPVDQSMVNGTQTLDDLFSRQDPAIAHLREALHDQLKIVVERLPRTEQHPLLSRNTGLVAFSDSWSVRLQHQGFHKNHFHSEGWLSSAFYLRVPEEVHEGAGEGWIKFGEPGFRAREPLAPEYWVKPVEGALVVFPSFLWHGTEPLKHARERMTVGYDILPG